MGVIRWGMRLRGISGALVVWIACTPHERAQEPSSLCAAGMALVDGDRLGALAVQRFCVDTTEVTTAAYGACVRAGACTPAIVGDGGGCNLTRADRADHPINCTTWAQAQAYCGWVGKRLPDDDEWIWAARGGTPSNLHPWGNAPPDATRACWDRKGQGTCPIGSAPAGASPAGVLDLIGNVAEWTRGHSEGIGGRGRLRGGSWQDSTYNQPIDERIADSARDEPTEAATLASGLRCVVAPLTPVQEVDDSGFTPHVPTVEGPLPVLGAAPNDLAPSRPLANLAALQRSGEASDSMWPLGAGYVELDVAVAAALGLEDAIVVPTLPQAIRDFTVLRPLRGSVLMTRGSYQDRKYIAVEPGSFKIRWQVSLETRGYGELVAPRSLVVQAYGAVADTLIGHSLDSGRELWRIVGAADQPFLRIRKLWLDGERAYLLGDRGLAAVDTVTGAILWTGVSVAGDCGVAVATERIVVEDPAQGHRLLDPATGATLRRIRGATGSCMWDRGTWDGGVAVAAVAEDRLVAFDPPAPDRTATLRAFDLETGAERWRHAKLDPELLLADHDAVYVQRVPEVLTALDGATGQQRAEVSIGSRFTATVEQAGGIAGPAVVVTADHTGTWILGRAPQPAVPETYTIRGRLVPDNIAKRRVADVPVRVGDRKVRTDANGRFEVRGRALGAIGITLGNPRGPGEIGGSRVTFEPSAVVLTGKGKYDAGDIPLREWELY